jgi:predicted O-methyltransferase YrrM
MATQSSVSTQSLDDYVLSVSLREPDVLHQLRQTTAQHPDGGMQTAPEQGQLLALLVQLIQAKKIIEIGTLTGYTTLWLALALPPDGRIIACDVNEDYGAIARRYWQTAGVADQIDLRIAPAVDTLDSLLATGEADTFDFIYIDADKNNYDTYYEKSLQLLRVGGLIAIDNTLWMGQVIDPEIQDEDTVAIRELNQKIHQDQRVQMSLVAIVDGLTLALKQA